MLYQVECFPILQTRVHISVQVTVDATQLMLQTKYTCTQLSGLRTPWSNCRRTVETLCQDHGVRSATFNFSAWLLLLSFSSKTFSTKWLSAGCVVILTVIYHSIHFEFLGCVPHLACSVHEGLSIMVKWQRYNYYTLVEPLEYMLTMLKWVLGLSLWTLLVYFSAVPYVCQWSSITAPFATCSEVVSL